MQDCTWLRRFVKYFFLFFILLSFFVLPYSAYASSQPIKQPQRSGIYNFFRGIYCGAFWRLDDKCLVELLSALEQKQGLAFTQLQPIIIKGEKGDQGDQGDQGDRGYQGLQGIPGTAAFKGDKGDQGISGNGGASGAKGDKGDRGDNGSITGVTAGSGLSGGGTSGSVTLSISVGNGVVITSNAITLTLPTSLTSSNTSSNSGLELSSSGLALLRGCSGNQILRWNSTTSLWECKSLAYVSSSGDTMTGALNLSSGLTYKIDGTDVLSGTTLGAGVISSSLTSIGALNSGSITSGFGSIDTGADNITTTGTMGSAGNTLFTGLSQTLSGTGNALTLSGVGANLAFTGAGVAQITTATSQNLALIPGGSVGIGTTNPTQQLELSASLGLVMTTSATTGVIYKGADRFIHNFRHPTGDTAVPAGENTFIGINAGNFTMGSTATDVGDGSYNTGVGVNALKANATGTHNTAVGVNALLSNTDGDNNSAFGVNALKFNTTGSHNAAFGLYALHNNLIGSYNTAVGTNALEASTGDSNVAVGMEAMLHNLGGTANTAVGTNALFTNTSGSYNVAVGMYALQANLTANNNTAIGFYALHANTGAQNTAIGKYASDGITTGSYNTVLGYGAGRYQANGTTVLTDPENSVYIGAGTRGYSNADSNSIVIGYNAIGLGANTTVLGSTSTLTTAIYGNVGIGTTNPGTYKTYINGSLAVNSDTADKTGANTWGTLSDVKLKDIQGDYTLGLNEIMQLNPIKFNYKAVNLLGLDSTKTYEGFIAQDVQKVIPEAVSMRPDGYLRLNADPILWAMLNAIKEQQLQIATLSGQLISGSLSTVEITQNTRLQALEAIFEGIITTFKKAVTFLADVTFGGRVTFKDKDLAGYAKIKQGAKEVKITYEKPYEIQPVVNVTVKKENISFAVSDESKEGFTIKITSVASEDINFSWIAIMVKDAKTYESSDSVPTPTLVPTIIPDLTSTPTPTKANETSATDSGILVIN